MKFSIWQRVAESHAAAALAGVDAVVTVTNAANAQPLAAVLAPQVVALAAGYVTVRLYRGHD
mgnify:CR=1 FL=1